MANTAPHLIDWPASTPEWSTLPSMPLRYGDPAAELRAIDHERAFLDASALVCLRAGGVDASDYLNRRLSQKMIDWTPGESRHATLLEATGHLLADLHILRTREDFVLLSLPAAPADELLNLLNMYVFTEDCTFTHQPHPALLAVSTLLFDRLRNGAPDLLVGCVNLAAAFLPGFHLILARDEARARKIVDTLRADGAIPVGGEALNGWRVRTGVPWWGTDVSPKDTPLEVGWLDAIHTDKGCYPGQESMAKTLNLGRPARLMVRVQHEFGDVSPIGSELHSPGSDSAGMLTSIAKLPTGSVEGLGLVRFAYTSPGTRLVTPSGEGWAVQGPVGKQRDWSHREKPAIP